MEGRLSAQPGEQRASATRTRIDLCGSLTATIRGTSVGQRLPGRQGRAMFAYLVLNRQRPVSRDELLDVLWPTDLPEAPEAGVSTILARVRRAVGDGVIEGRSELRLRLDPDAVVDVELATTAAQAAERVLAAGDPRAAIEQATIALGIIDRPLLPGLDGTWLEAHRSALGALEPALLEVLARAALAIGGPEHLGTAERVARALAERHPFRESGHALLIEVHGRRGNVAEATLVYDRLRVFLRDELGTVPSAHVSALHDELLREGRLPGDEPAARPAQATATAAAHVSPAAGNGRVPLPVIGGIRPATAFVGRRGQLERLGPPWLEAGTGQRRLTLLVGDAGVGKTRLAAQFAAEVHGTGATVLYGRCDEEPLLSYQPFIEALRHLLRHGDLHADPEAQRDLAELSRIIPEARPQADPVESDPSPDPETERYRLFEAVARLIGRAADRSPLLFVLDDVHWADKPTLLLLRHLLRHSDPARVLVLGMFRDVDVRDDHPLAELVADLRRERRYDRIDVGGLSESETDALVAAHLTANASAGFVRGLRTQTEGNPFFIEEALRSLLEAQAVRAGEPAPESALESIGVPDSVADVVLSRLGRISELAGEALTIGAIAGREFDLAVVQALLDTSALRVIEALEEAMAAGLVAEVADAVDRFAFCHGLARDAIYHRVSRTRRLRLHLQVARALEQAGGSPSELAHHFFLAREVGAAQEAIEHSVLAGDEAARSLAYEESVEHYRRALDTFAIDASAGEERRCDVLLALGRAQWRAGDSAARTTHFEAAASARERGAAIQLARAALGLGERYWEANAADRRYAELIAEALHTLPTDDSKIRTRLMGRMAENLHFTQERAAGELLSREALEMARRIGDPVTLITALMSRHVSLLHINHLDERVRLIDEVLTLAGSHRALSAEARHWRLFDCCELGDMEGARRDLAALEEVARVLRQPLLEHLAVGWKGCLTHLAGDVEKAERLASASSELARQAQVWHATSYLAGMLFTIRRQQGRVSELLPMMESLSAGMSAATTWDVALALARVESGAVEAGRREYERIVADDFAAVAEDWYWFISTSLLAETCSALDDAENAERLYDRLLPYGDRFVQVIFTACWGSAWRHLGMLASVLGRFDESEEHFRAALAANEGIGAVLMTAETQCEYGAMLLRRGAGKDRQRAAALGQLVVEVALPRRLAGLARRGSALSGHR